MSMILTFFALLAGSAHALTPPVGWTSQGKNRALLDTSDPLKGEIIEVILPDTSDDPRALIDALGKAGLVVDRFGSDDDGTLNLVLPGRLGRARSEIVGKSRYWWVVIVGQAQARHLDPDALLKAMAPTPEDLTWGEKEAAPGGSDGSPWGAVAEADKPAGGWMDQITVKEWTQDEAVIGVWEGQENSRNSTIKLRFRFENTGLLQVERTDEAGAKVLQGNWATRGELMQMDIEGGGSNLPYHATERTLSVMWHGTSVSLYKR